MTRIEEMAAFSGRVRYEDLPEDVRYKLKVCILDALECCLSDMEDDRSLAAYRSIPKGDMLAACIFGDAARASAEDAAFYNTVKGALTNRNDSSRTAICHPGCILVPVVLALGEETNANGKDVLEAMLAGYETMIRLGTTFVQAHINDSFRKTALVGAFGAAFSAARMLHLDDKGIASAASFACHAAGGVNEWAVAGTGEDVFQNGWGARNGVLSARLAAAGADGAKTILEGKNGLLAAFGATKEEALLTDGLGTRYDILSVMHKPINCCFIVQPPSQTAKGLLDKYHLSSLSPEQVKKITIDISRQGKEYPGCDNTKEIRSLVQGIMSIAFGVSSTLFLGSHDHINWAPPVHPEILELLHKCELRENKSMTDAFPLKMGAGVTVEMNDGTVYTNLQEDVIPLTPDEVLEKFQDTASRRLGKDRALRIHDTVMALETLSGIKTLSALLVP